MEVIFDSFLGVSAWLCIHTHENLGSNFTKKTRAGLKRTSLPLPRVHLQRLDVLSVGVFIKM